MGARRFFDLVSETRTACTQMHRVLKGREEAAGLAKACFGSSRASGISDPTSRAASAIEELCARLDEQLLLLSRLEACGLDLLGFLPKENWVQAMKLHYLEGYPVEAVGQMMGYSTRGVYNHMKKACDWIDANVLLSEVLRGHCLDWLAGEFAD